MDADPLLPERLGHQRAGLGILPREQALGNVHEVDVGTQPAVRL